MKKMVSFISALTMCAVMTAPMFSSAAEGENPDTQETTSSLTDKTVTVDSTDTSSTVCLTREITSSYTVIIPDGSIDLKDPKDISVSAQNVVIDDGQALTVSVSSANEWKLMDEKEGSTASLSYDLTPDGAEALTGSEAVEILSVAAGTAWNSTVTKNMKVAINGNATMSGTYKDTLTFTVAVGDASQKIEDNTTEPTSQENSSENQENQE